MGLPRDNWDKLRRQKKARSSYSPIDSFKSRKARTSKLVAQAMRNRKLSRKQRRFHNRQKPRERIKPIVNDQYWWRMFIFDAAGRMSTALFECLDGDWRCIECGSTELDSLVRITNFTEHADAIQAWIRVKGFRYTWGPRLDQRPRAGLRNRIEPANVNPAEAYPREIASHPSGGNTVTLSNAELSHIATRVVSDERTSPQPGAEWLNHSSPLNSPGCPGDPKNALSSQ